MIRALKIFITILILQSFLSCKKDTPTGFLAGNWKITSAVGNDGRHWVGTFTLKANGDNYTGLFDWKTVDGSATGTDSVEGSYDHTKKVLTLRSVVISGNIESVLYTAQITGNYRSMKGIWTGSSDGSIENPGRWTAEKQ